MTKYVLISAGETSGDIHASNLIKNLKEFSPGVRFFGIGGERMEAAGVDMVKRMDNLSIIGVTGILSNLKHLNHAFKGLVKKAKTLSPALAILIDYPGFNLILAKRLKKIGIPVVYYITPQVWAWGGWRIRTIKKYVDKAVVILRFEEELFKKHGIDASFVGHPLLDREAKTLRAGGSLGLDKEKFTVALLPGSRKSEVLRMLPVMLKTAEIISRKKDTQFVLLKSSGVSENIYETLLKKTSVKVTVVKDDTCGCLSLSDFVFTSSGTATLESAIMEKPMLITYKTSFLTALLFKTVARTRFIGLVNIIAGKEIAPELLQYDARPERLASSILSIISSRKKLDRQVQELRQVKTLLGTSGASRRAARIISDFIKQQR